MISLLSPLEVEVDATLTIDITTNAPGEVSLVLDPTSATICSLSGRTITALQVGSCVVTATSVATDTVAAGFAQKVITVHGIAQSISFDADGAQTATPIRFGENPALTATATSGLLVSFTETPGASCGVYYDLSGPLPVAHLGYMEPGSCTIIATQSGSARYRAAESVRRTFTIIRGLQSISTNGLYNRP